MAALAPSGPSTYDRVILAAADESRNELTPPGNLVLARTLADKVYVFGQDKRLAGTGTPAEILGNTALLQANNLIHIHPHHDRDHKVMKA